MQPLLFYIVLTSVLSQIINTSINATNQTSQVASYFVSFSVEWQGLRKLFLNDPKVPDNTQVTLSMLQPRSLQMIKNLGLASGIAGVAALNYTTVLRVGGNSATKLWWTPSTPWSTNTSEMVPVGKLEMQLLNVVATQTNSRLVINIGSRDPSLTASYSDVLLEAVKENINPQLLDGIEVGNEPDQYSSKGYRTDAYAYQDFINEFKAISSYVQSKNMPVIGPSFAGRWKNFSSAFAQNVYPIVIDKLSIHHYSVSGCATNEPTLNDLLPYNASKYDFIKQTISSLKQSSPNTQVILTELGSASCAGIAGVSDTFGSGLWAVGAAMELASAGVTYAAFTGSPQALYAPLQVSAVSKKTRTYVVMPTYYAMVFSNLATAGQGTTVTQIPSSNPLIQTWLAKNQKWTTIVVINSQTTAISQSFSVFSTASVAKMLTMNSTNGLTSTTGFMIGNIDFNSDFKSQSGKYFEESLIIQNSVVQVSVPAASAVLVRVSDTDLGPVMPQALVQNADSYSNSGMKVMGCAWLLMLVLLI